MIIRKSFIYIGLLFLCLSYLNFLYITPDKPKSTQNFITYEDMCFTHPASNMDCIDNVCPLTNDPEICCCQELNSGQEPFILSQLSTFKCQLPDSLTLKNREYSYYKSTYHFSLQTFQFNTLSKPPESLLS